MSSAFHLSRRFPTASITLLEKSPRLGGWVYSERVDVRDAQGNEARILLERGPRTLRPNGKAILELVRVMYHPITISALSISLCRRPVQLRGGLMYCRCPADDAWYP